MLNGVAVILGHSFPIFLKFKGGKGGACVIGILAFLMPRGALIYLAIFLLLMWVTRVPTLSYGVDFISFIFIGLFVYHSWQLAVYTVALIVLVVLRYIPRLLGNAAEGG